MKPKLLVLGHGRSGKTTVAEILEQDYGYKCAGSSEFANTEFIFPALKDKYGYATPGECHADRHNHRAEWYDLICEYNKDDPARLAKELLKEHDVYVGMRSNREYQASKHLFDKIWWIDRNVPAEPESSFDIKYNANDGMIIIDNTWSLDDLKTEIFYEL